MLRQLEYQLPPHRSRKLLNWDFQIGKEAMQRLWPELQLQFSTSQYWDLLPAPFLLIDCFLQLKHTVEASIRELQIGHSKKQIYLIFLLIHRNLKHFASKLRLFLQRVYFANPQALCLRIPHWLVHFFYP